MLWRWLFFLGFFCEVVILVYEFSCNRGLWVFFFFYWNYCDGLMVFVESFNIFIMLMLLVDRRERVYLVCLSFFFKFVLFISILGFSYYLWWLIKVICNVSNLGFCVWWINYNMVFLVLYRSWILFIYINDSLYGGGFNLSEYYIL